MDLGIQEFRNCELLSIFIHNGITPNYALIDFLRDHHIWGIGDPAYGLVHQIINSSVIEASKAFQPGF